MADILETSVLLRTRRMLISVLAALGLLALDLLMSSSPIAAQTASVQSASPTLTSTTTSSPTVTDTTTWTASAVILPTAGPKPMITLDINGQTLTGVPGSFCWPQVGESACTLVDDPQPIVFVPLSISNILNSKLVHVKFDPPSTIPLDTILSYPDDSNATSLQINGQAITGMAYLLDPSLKPGKHRLIIQALYTPDADGNQNYVEYVFGIQLDTANGGASTAAATVNATSGASATAIVTSAVTMQSTLIATAQVTAQATKAVTKPVATPVATAASTTAATPVVITLVVAPTNTKAATTAPSKTSAPIATTPAVTAAVTTAPSKTLTSVVTQAATKAATVPATKTPTIPSTTVVPTVAPTVTPFIIAPATATATSTVPPSATPVLMNGLPALTITSNGQQYQPIAMTFLQAGTDGTPQVVTRPVNAPNQLVTAVRGTAAQITFGGPSPTTELITITNADGTQTISQDLVAAGSDIFYTLPTQPGLYGIYIALRWPADNPQNGQATYIFRLNLTN